jgi:hypothetical protein
MGPGSLSYVRFQYDKPAPVGCNIVDQPTAILRPDAGKTTFTYDNRNRLISTIDGNGGVTRNTYDERKVYSSVANACEREKGRSGYFRPQAMLPLGL